MKDLFPNALHVARREYLVRVRGRAFAITTALLAISIAAVTMVPTILAAVGVADPPRIAVDLQAEDLPSDPVLELQIALITGTGNEDAGGEEADRPRVTRADDPDAAARDVRDGELEALLTITRDDEGELAYEYLGSASPTNQTRMIVTAFAQAFTIADRLARAGIDPQQTQEIFEPPAFTPTPVDPDDASDPDDFGGAFILAYAVVILTFMAILTYGNWVAQSVAEEKSGRVMELLITAATPRQLLIGKVLGTGAAGLTQYLAIVAAAIIGFLANGPVAGALGVTGRAPISLPDLEPAMLLGFAAFFVLGFLLYSTLYAAAGSMVSRIEDVQQAVGEARVTMEGTAFVQPVAGHTDVPSYLIVRDIEDNWFLWLGNEEAGLTEIPESTAAWIRDRPEIEDIPQPRFWFEESSLPVAERSPKIRIN